MEFARNRDEIFDLSRKASDVILSCKNNTQNRCRSNRGRRVRKNWNSTTQKGTKRKLQLFFK